MHKIHKYSFLIFCSFLIIYGVLSSIKTELKDTNALKKSLHKEEISYNNKNKEYCKKEPKKNSPDEKMKYELAIRTPSDLKKPTYSGNYLMEELARAKEHVKKRPKNYKMPEFKERGPGNVGGRTRAFVFNYSDTTLSTWMAGSATGGAWVTADRGESWRHVTQSLPNLGVNTLANNRVNPEVVYAGTGEHFTSDIDGAGIFKSADFGENWEHILSPDVMPALKNISRIIVNPENSEIVIAAGRNSVYGDTLISTIAKSEDGGQNWVPIFNTLGRVDDVDFASENFDVIYASVNSEGVYKTIDGGQTWELKDNGFIGGGRIEITISPVNSEVLWMSVADGSGFGADGEIYFSNDGAESWSVLQPQADDVFSVLGGQGWYDNIITAHPYNESAAYVGGVGIFKVISSNIERSITTLNVEAPDYFQLVNFNGNTSEGVLIGEGQTLDSFPRIVVRFGQGGQKAYRFTVDGRSSGVPAADYIYRDFVDVPFQVWDETNNQQLAVSFRDQNEDGQWLPADENIDLDLTREYVFIHDLPYSLFKDPNIAQNGGHEFENYVFFWTGINSSIVQGALPESDFVIETEIIGSKIMSINPIADPYFDHGGLNSGVHPDHHNIVILDEDPNDSDFQIINTNDGGIFLSIAGNRPGENENDFEFKSNGYNTTQFYSADKSPNSLRFVGGMQDNSSYLTPFGAGDSDPSTHYRFALGGDGFEALWNNRDTNQIIVTSQFGNFAVSTDGGRNWSLSNEGLADNIGFYTRVANSRKRPDVVYTVGSDGVSYRNGFDLPWNTVTIPFDNWFGQGDVEVSRSNPDIIWAGSILNDIYSLAVSTDAGLNYQVAENYDKYTLGRITRIESHPTEDHTAYALFSFQGRPKILKTDDLGQSWSDISGFEESEDGKSTRGFPDVAVTSLFVFPNNTDKIWVGTEIGLVESLNAGQSWQLMETEMGASNINDIKQQGGHLVIASYGRGIWSTHLEELDKVQVINPFLVDIALNIENQIITTANFANVFDSIQVFENDVLTTTIYDNELGDIDLISPLIVEEDIEFKIFAIGFLDGEEYKSNTLVKNLSPLGDNVVIEYFNDFDTPVQEEDFDVTDFSYQQPNGFSSQAIGSPHPYAEGSVEYITQLNFAVRITGEQEIIYDDIAIIETGEAGAEFGDEEFWDYVVLEYSFSGLQWTPLEPGYDASYSGRWETLYNRGGQVTEDEYITHTISLHDKFDQGDVILLRFRLFSDPLVNGWGWIMDNFEIKQNQTSPVVEIDKTEFEIYPNPASNFVHIINDESFDLQSIELYNSSGMLLRKSTVDLKEKNIQFDIQGINPGMYLIKINGKKDFTSKRIVIN